MGLEGLLVDEHGNARELLLLPLRRGTLQEVCSSSDWPLLFRQGQMHCERHLQRGLLHGHRYLVLFRGSTNEEEEDSLVLLLVDAPLPCTEELPPAVEGQRLVSRMGSTAMLRDAHNSTLLMHDVGVHQLGGQRA